MRGSDAHFGKLFFRARVDKARRRGRLAAVGDTSNEAWRPPLAAIFSPNCSSPNAEKFCRIGLSTEHDAFLSRQRISTL